MPLGAGVLQLAREAVHVGVEHLVRLLEHLFIGQPPDCVGLAVVEGRDGVGFRVEECLGVGEMGAADGAAEAMAVAPSPRWVRKCSSWFSSCQPSRRMSVRSWSRASGCPRQLGVSDFAYNGSRALAVDEPVHPARVEARGAAGDLVQDVLAVTVEPVRVSECTREAFSRASVCHAPRASYRCRTWPCNPSPVSLAAGARLGGRAEGTRFPRGFG